MANLLRLASMAATTFLCSGPAFAACASESARLDRNVAIIAVDLQRSLLAHATRPSLGQVIASVRPLLDGFRSLGKPVILVRSARQPPGRTEQVHPRPAHADPGRSELLPALGLRPNDHVVEKRGWSAFTGTDLASFLASRHVTQVVILGYSTTVAVEATARDAYDRGYNVTIVADGITDTDTAGQDWAVSKLFPKLGEVTSSDNLVRCLASTR